MRFDEVAQRMTELNDPKKGDLNITMARSALRCALLALTEGDPLEGLAFVTREMQRYRSEIALQRKRGNVHYPLPKSRRPASGRGK